MKIISFRVKEMHGYIDVDLLFKDDMSIIVGGNGSGKTSALSLLANVLRVDISEIQKTKFSEIELQYEHVEKRRTNRFTLKIVYEDNGPRLSLYRSSDLIAEQFIPVKPASMVVQWADGDSPTWTKIYDMFGMTKAEKNEKSKNVEKIVKIPAKVTFVRLDRAISAIDSHGGVSFEEPDAARDLLLRTNKVGKLRDPLDVVGEVISKKYVLYRNRLEEIKARTYDQLFSIHFSDSDLTSESGIRIDRLEKKLTDLEQRLSISGTTISSLKDFTPFQTYLQNTKKINEIVQKAKMDRKTGRRTRIEDVLSAQLASRSKKLTNC